MATIRKGSTQKASVLRGFVMVLPKRTIESSNPHKIETILVFSIRIKKRSFSYSSFLELIGFGIMSSDLGSRACTVYQYCK